jgi:predicted permease
MLAKRPGTSMVAVVALALGIGLTTLVFSVVEGVMLRGLPFDEADRLMTLERIRLAEPGRRESVPFDDFADWRDRQRSFEDLAAMADEGVVVSAEGTFPEQVQAARITPNTLSLLRAQPLAGRGLTEADAAPGAPSVALVGYRLWVNHLGGDPAAVGRTIRVDGEPTTVAGVMPEGFGFPHAHHLWRPLATMPPAERGRAARVQVVGRLAAGVTAGEAEVEIAGIARQLAAEHPENEGTSATLGPYVQRELPDRVSSLLLTMLTAVFGVLLVACVNVTNLQLARAADRAHEVAVRTALGSSRWRIVRQHLAEGVLLSAAGALAGLAIARTGTALFMNGVGDTSPPFWIDVRIDRAVLLFVTAVTVLSALVSSVLPGWRASRADVNAALKDESRGATGVRIGAFSRWLVVVEVTASCMLLVVSGLMIRSITATSRLDYPYATEDVFYAQVNLPADLPASAPREQRNAALQLRVEAIEQAIARVRGVRRVALASELPGQNDGERVSIEGVVYASDADRPRARRVAVTAGLFDVLRVAPSAGRVIAAEDRDGALPVAVLEETFARRHFAGGAALGRRIRYSESAPWLTVVGIVPDLGLPDETGLPAAGAYVPLAQQPSSWPVILASTAGDPIAITPDVRRAIAGVSDRAPVSDPNSLAGELWRRGWAFRLFGGLFLSFGLAALLLAAAGLYGVMALGVRRRTREIGVRLALGASRRRVLTTVLWQGLWRVALGIVLGLVPGWFIGTRLTALLANVEASDPVVHVTTAATLLAAGALACLAPAVRAAGVDPAEALRGVRS